VLLQHGTQEQGDGVVREIPGYVANAQTTIGIRHIHPFAERDAGKTLKVPPDSHVLGGDRLRVEVATEV